MFCWIRIRNNKSGSTKLQINIFSVLYPRTGVWMLDSNKVTTQNLVLNDWVSSLKKYLKGYSNFEKHGRSISLVGLEVAKGCIFYQCCGAGAGGPEIIWDLEPEPKLNF